MILIERVSERPFSSQDNVRASVESLFFLASTRQEFSSDEERDAWAQRWLGPSCAPLLAARYRDRRDVEESHPLQMVGPPHAETGTPCFTVSQA